jgi:tetratricopeptide (TPR) repeat protein
LNDQPFSSRPTTLASYIAAVALGAYEESAKIARTGLVANPKDFTLLNNLAFALGHMGQVKEAREVFGRIRAPEVSGEEKFVWLATNGFLCYREGDAAKGRKLYMDALQKMGKATDEKRRASAFLWMAMEELRIGSPEAAKYKAEVVDLAKKLPYPDLRPLIKRIEENKP